MLVMNVNSSRNSTLGGSDKKEYKITINHIDDGKIHRYKNVKVSLRFNSEDDPLISNSGVRIRDPAIFQSNPIINSSMGSDTAPVVINLGSFVGDPDSEDNIKELDMEIITGIDPVSKESWGKTTPPNDYTLLAEIRYNEEIILEVQAKQDPITVTVTDN